MKTFWKFKVGAQCPDIIPLDTMIRMSNSVKDVSCEEGRFLMLYDIETGQDLPIELKQMQHEMLPTMATELITCKYILELSVQHDGLLSKATEVPSLTFPIILVADP